MRTTDRWWAWTGPVFTVGFLVSAFALTGSTPGEKDSAAKVLAYYNSHRGRTLTDAFLGPLAALLLVAFAAYVRARARERAAPQGIGPTVLVGGSVLWASGLLIGSVMELALVASSQHKQGQVAQTLNVLSNNAWLPFIAGIAVTMVGAGLTTLRSGVLPRWLGWVALAAGVVSLAGPGGFLGFFVAPLWLLVAGVLLFFRPEPPVPASVPSRESVSSR